MCPCCRRPLNGGVVFITGISGSGIETILRGVAEQAASHGHAVQTHDVGAIMQECALEHDPEVRWDKILDAPERSLRYLRALAFQRILYEVESAPDILHLIDLHLSFRWNTYLTKGLEPYILQKYIPKVRCFVNIIENLAEIQERLRHTTWGQREILELLIWRDEELLLTDMFAGICGRVPSIAVAKGEPASVIENLIWHPERKTVYLSFPMTAIKNDRRANAEITEFRDVIRPFLTVFDPHACSDYDKTFELPEMKTLRGRVGEATVDRDFRFINQADAVVVYYPRKVESHGVASEMRHARQIGKEIFLYCPQELGGGPFQPPADHTSKNKKRFLTLLRRHLIPGVQGGKANHHLGPKADTSLDKFF